MSDLSLAVLVGRLTRDAELKYTNGGTALCKFSVATGTRKKKDGAWVDEASFWDIELWGKQGESLNQYLTKGKQVAVEGSMRQDRWEQDGTQRMKVVISANSVQLLGGGKESGEQAVRNTASTPDKPAERKSPYNPDGTMRAQASPPDDFTDDINF
jgi:single-strand DNA-binding protein